MKKRLFSLALIIITIFISIVGCAENKEEETILPEIKIIQNGAFKICALLPESEKSTQNIENGIKFANSLANTVNIGETIDISYTCTYYSENEDIKSTTEKLINENASVIIFAGDDHEIFQGFTEYTDEYKIPVISLSPFTHSANNYYSITLRPKYLASSAASYALDKGYKKTAVIFESSDKYFSDQEEVYRNTFSSCLGNLPAVYYQKGENANYSASALSGSNYDFILLIDTDNAREGTINELRTAGYSGEIMLSEILNKADVQKDTYNNCSFISKLENDSSNNVATMLIPKLASALNVKEDQISAATAYGYDAYMTALEGLKHFSSSTDSAFAGVISSEVSTTTQAPENITAAQYTNALSSISYVGINGLITFKNNEVTPSYIYIDNIFESESVFNKKYNFQN